LEENELKIAANSLKHEISAMEVKLAEKNKLASNQVNAIMKVRGLILFSGTVQGYCRKIGKRVAVEARAVGETTRRN
jgi:hypothetical protein